MKDIIKLLRVKHYIKNLLIFLPMFFGGAIADGARLSKACLGFLAFCAVSSAVYIINDYRDMDHDRQHPTKKNRPLASGRIRPRAALALAAACLAVAVLLTWLIGDLYAGGVLLLYLLLNIAYSMGLKNRPIIDVVILASGFVIRLYYGGAVTDIVISQWLYLVVVTGSLYMGLGKRRKELERQDGGQGPTREVLKYYTKSFLDKNMFVCIALTDVFYTLWALDMGGTRLIWTVPLFIILLMFYSLVAEADPDGDPVEVILKDRSLILYIVFYAACMLCAIYFL